MKNGVRYCYTKGQFKGNKWYSYYERSLSCMKGGFYDNALMDLERAIQLSDKDQWWLFMYGMHYMDYFPHREKGIVHFLKSFESPDPETELMHAKLELELSLDQEPSDRASYYLNLVRQHEIEINSKKSIPEISISIGSGIIINDTLWTKSMPVTIKGTIKDINYISEVTIQGETIYQDYSEQNIIVNHPLFLPQGFHCIEIKASNLRGKVRKIKLDIYVDRSGPLINITSFDENNYIKGYVSDYSQQISLYLIEDDIQRPLSLNDHQFSAAFSHKAEDLTVYAVDSLGNETKMIIRTSQNLMNKSDLNRMIASRDQTITSDSNYSTKKHEFTNSILIYGWPNKQIVYEKLIEIDGHIVSFNSLIKLSIQVKHQNKCIQNIDLLTKDNLPVKRLSFNQSLLLKENENIVKILGVDSYNRLISKKFHVISKMPDAFSRKQRLTVMMYPFDYEEWIDKTSLFHSLFSESFFRLFGPLSKKRRAVFQYEFSKSLANQNRFQIKIHDWLKEYYKVEKNDFNHIGSSQKTHALIIGDTSKYYDGVEIVARLVDLRSTKIFSTIDAFYSYDQSFDIFQMAAKLSQKFHNSFPILKGDVTIADGGQIYSSILKGNIISGWPVIIYQDSPPISNPVTGKFLGANKPVITDGFIYNDSSIKVRNKHVLFSINKARICTR